MSQTVRKRIHLIYGIALSAVTIIAGICMILSCYHIYVTGVQSGAEQIYSRAIVADAFSHIAIPVYLCLALTIGSFILHLALPLEKKKPVPEKNRQLILSRLQVKTDLTACDESLRAAIEAQQKGRKLNTIISAAVLAVCSIIFLVYACWPGRWPEAAEVTGAMVEAVLILLVCLVAPTACAIFTAYRNRVSLDKEIELMRQATAQAPVKPQKAVPAEAKLLNPMLIARYAILAAAIFFVIYGYASGGFDDVMNKANAICTECVGLG